MKWIKNNKALKGICGIYIISNIVTRISYVGSSFDIAKRLDSHLLNLQYRWWCENSELQRDFAKYGQDSFEVNILETVLDDNLLNEREKYWIEQTPRTYNSKKFYGRKPKREKR